MVYVVEGKNQNTNFGKIASLEDKAKSFNLYEKICIILACFMPFSLLAFGNFEIFGLTVKESVFVVSFAVIVLSVASGIFHSKSRQATKKLRVVMANQDVKFAFILQIIACALALFGLVAYEVIRNIFKSNHEYDNHQLIALQLVFVFILAILAILPAIFNIILLVQSRKYQTCRKRFIATIIMIISLILVASLLILCIFWNKV